MLIAAMTLYGTIGVFRHYIPLPSGLIACARGLIGALSLVVFLLILKKKPDWAVIRSNLVPLCLSGGALGANWVLLFEAYSRTTVASATLAYYFAPILLLIVAPFVLKERLTVRKVLCIFVALCGVVFISGVIGGGTTELSGIAFALGAALLYPVIVFLSKKLTEVNAFDKTVVQLLAAAAVTLPYTLLAEKWSFSEFTLAAAILLLIVCVVHTGVAYALYFGALRTMNAQTLAILSYIDPLVAVLLSALVLKEPFGWKEAVGAVLILGAALVSELPERRKSDVSTSGGRASPDDLR
ncbi:MAG: DMT family transporter [Oscillospiraceae bacterium]|nr:DMT family transporter [Oscillospiraceae bacterium]